MFSSELHLNNHGLNKKIYTVLASLDEEERMKRIENDASGMAGACYNNGAFKNETIETLRNSGIPFEINPYILDMDWDGKNERLRPRVAFDIRIGSNMIKLAYMDSPSGNAIERYALQRVVCPNHILYIKCEDFDPLRNRSVRNLLAFNSKVRLATSFRELLLHVIN